MGLGSFSGLDDEMLRHSKSMESSFGISEVQRGAGGEVGMTIMRGYKETDAKESNAKYGAP